MTFDDYSFEAVKTDKTMSHDDAIPHALFGLASEVGEIHAHFQKDYQGKPLNRSLILQECGDALWFLDKLCRVLDSSLEEVAEANIAKLSDRYRNG